MKLFFKALVCVTAISSFNSQAKIQNTKVGYDQDGRQDISEINNGNIKLLSKSVAGRVHRWAYSYNEENQQGSISFFQPDKLSDAWGANVCKDEKFAEQTSLVDCSGFLVGEDLLVTAGHCSVDMGDTVKNRSTFQCEDYQWLFDYEHNGTDMLDLQNVDRNKMYRCKKVVYGRLDENHDFAIIQLDRKVTDRPFLKMRQKGKIENNNSIFVIGHPSGLPKKYAGDANVLDNSKHEYFSTNLDTFGGNSGSPVFNAKTLEVEGILVRGKIDYVPSTKDGEDCMRINRCNSKGENCTENDTEIDGEQVTRITELTQFIK